MRKATVLVASLWILPLAYVLLIGAPPAFAYVACSTSGDCWQTSAKVSWPGLTLIFHGDDWWNEHKNDQRYRLHEADDQHNWHRGYWADREWHSG